ncbi:MAG: PKD domain-containing protein [bacterium]
MNLRSFLPLAALAIVGLVLVIPGCDELVTQSTTVIQYDSTLGQECVTCHTDDYNRYLRPKSQYENSRHASDELLQHPVEINGELGLASQCGARCHTHEGFLDYIAKGTAGGQSSPNVIKCFTCHAPHTGDDPRSWSDSLRGISADAGSDYTLLAGNAVYAHGKSNACAMCHQAVNGAPSNSAERILSADWGPHFSPQADVLIGKNGAWFGQEPPDTNSHDKVTDGCLGCHYGKGQGYLFGEHTFRLSNPQTGEGYLTNCRISGCHSATLRRLDSLAHFSNYDSLPILADSLRQLLATWGILDPDDPTRRSFDPGADLNDEQIDVLHNYLLYQSDGSRGVHNPRFFGALLSKSLTVWSEDSPPHADFEVSVSDGCAPLAVEFTDRSTSMSGIESWRWIIEDTLDNQGGFDYTYANPGVYTVTLIVEDHRGHVDTVSKAGVVTVWGPEAQIWSDIDSGFAPLDVTFMDSSTCADVDSIYYEWDFGDDSTLILEDPGVHTFDTISDFQVSLKIIDARDSVTVLSTATKSIRALGPQVAFASDWKFDHAPFTVHFTDNSQPSDQITNWLWDFGDPNSLADTSVEQNPSYTYTKPGFYDVRLLIVTPLDSVAAIKHSFIEVWKPAANFWVSAVDGCAPLEVTFHNTSRDMANIKHCLWYYLNNAGDTLKTRLQQKEGGIFPPFTDTLTTAGWTTVILTAVFNDDIVVDDDSTHSRLRSKLIDVEGPDAGFTASLDTTCSGTEIAFTLKDTTCLVGVTATHEWYFGNDSIAVADAEPIKEMNVVGNQIVKHVVTTVYGSDTAYGQVTILGPSAAFSTPDTAGCIGMIATFTATPGCAVDSFVWDFGDVSTLTTTDSVVTHTYTQTGKRTVGLTVTQGDFTATTDSVNYISVQQVVAEFSVSDTIVCAGTEVQFTDLSDCDPAQWLWKFTSNASDTSNEQNPTFVYQEAGLYNVQLTATDSSGIYSDLEFKSEHIRVIPDAAPNAAISGDNTVQFGQLTYFSADTTGFITLWQWTLKDSTGASIESYEATTAKSAPWPLTIQNAGVYTITLRVVNICGREDYAEFTVTAL